MSWAIGFDETWKRDIGYGVPAKCDHPNCNADIDRGLSYVCGGEPYGGEEGCGLYFCSEHHRHGGPYCERCAKSEDPFEPKPDVPEWVNHKLTCPTWKRWRQENPAEVEQLKANLTSRPSAPKADVGGEA